MGSDRSDPLGSFTDSSIFGNPSPFKEGVRPVRPGQTPFSQHARGPTRPLPNEFVVIVRVGAFSMSWFPLRAFQSSRRTPRRQPGRRAWARCEELETRLAPSVNVLTFHNDIASTGVNASEN